MRHRFGPPEMHGHHWMHHGPPWGHPAWPGMLASTLTTVMWIVLLTGLIWLLLKWVLPNILPTLTGIFGWQAAENPPALEILRQRYAAGEIDGDTFEQMRERLEVSYRSDTWSGPRNASYQPGAYRQGDVKMAEQEQHPRD